MLNGHAFRYFPIKAMILPGSIFGPTLFLIIINDLPDIINRKFGIYVDGTNIYFS